MAHNKRMSIRAGRLLDSDPVMILVSDDSKGPGGGRYSPLWEQALSCDQSSRRDIPFRHDKIRWSLGSERDRSESCSWSGAMRWGLHGGPFLML